MLFCCLYFVLVVYYARWFENLVLFYIIYIITIPLCPA